MRPKARLAMALALAAMGSAALAHSGVKDDDVKARMAVMMDIGKQMKLIGSMAKGQAAFDAEAANAALAEIADHSAQIAPSFTPQADDPKSEALPVIWQAFEEFETLASETESLAQDLSGTVKTQADLAPVLGQLGGSCKACHKVFRE